MKPDPKDPPAWKQDFPVRWDEDAYVTRREFTKFLGLTSLAFLLGTLWAVASRWSKASREKEALPLRVASVDEIPVGGYKQFHYPTPDDPGILVRLESDKFAAYNQLCTHLSCPVHFQAATRELVCPCHEGHFSAEDGRPLAGPPKRPLTRWEVNIRDGQVWVQHSSSGLSRKP